MKFLEKIRAIFNFKGQRAEMELKSAEVRGNKIFLHPKDDPYHTFCVSGKAIDIVIDPSVEMTEDDFFVIENEKLTTLEQQMEMDPAGSLEKILHTQALSAEQKTTNQSDKSKSETDATSNKKEISKTSSEQNSQAKNKTEPPEKENSKQPVTTNSSTKNSPPKMHIVSMRLYQDEYDLLMDAIEEKGYKKTEFLLACVAAAKKKSMETNYRKYYEERMRRRKEQRDAAKRAAEEQPQQENMTEEHDRKDQIGA